MAKDMPTNLGWQCPVQPGAALQLFLFYLSECGGCFKQSRTALRAIKFILGLLTTPGRKTCVASRAWRNLESDESADYKVFSRCEWDIRSWFSVVIKHVIDLLPPARPLVIGLDDTALRKWGKNIPQARYVHDPLAIKWLKQRFAWGIRVLQLAILLPFDYAAGRAYAIPIGFYPKPAAKKPRGKQVSQEELASYQAAKVSTKLTTQAVEEVKKARQVVDQLGHPDLPILVVADGSYLNGPFVKRLIPRVEIVGRVKGNARLFSRAMVRVRNTFYGSSLPTPQEIGQDKAIHWKSASLMWGGRPQNIKFKEIKEVYWRAGTGRRPMRLIVIAGTPYKPRNKRRRKNLPTRKFYFRKPGYLLTSDLTSQVNGLIQDYLDRWQVECAFRDAKTGLGVSHPQNSSFESVERIPSAMVAVYSLWMLAVLKTHGPAWSEAVVPLRPHQRRRMLRREAEGKSYTRRFSQQDFIRLLRRELERCGVWGGFGADENGLPSRLDFSS